MPFLLRLALLCVLVLLTGACAHKTMVALVPDPDGKPGAITVASEGGTVAFSTPYQATTVKDAGKPPTEPEEVDRKELLRSFSSALSVQPSQPLHFLFYFSGDITPSPDSPELLQTIVAAIRQRRSGFVSVIGHADTTASGEYNSALSLKRALVVRDLLVEWGVAAATIYPSWVGEKLPPVPTADEVREPGNRTVEVIVR